MFQEACQLIEYMTQVRHHLHQYPELSRNEHETSRFIRHELGAIDGIEILDLPLETGVVAMIRGQGAGPEKVTALRADIDALPIQEQTGLHYQSSHAGIMHACGHDGHTAILLGVAKILSSKRSAFSGIVKLLFQPAEEQLWGARHMIEAGVLENPRVETIVGVHGGIEAEIGKIGLYAGPFMASTDRFTVKIKGVGAHAAYPHRGKDAMLATGHCIVALQGIVSREIDAVEKAVLSICKISGGNAFNILPAEVEFCGTVRNHNEELRRVIRDKMDRMIGGIAAAHDCTHQLDYVFGVPGVVNHPATVEKLAEAAGSSIGSSNVTMMAKPLMGSEDFALYLQSVPQGCMYRLGIAGCRPVQLHTATFDFPDEALPVGAAVMANFILETHK